jgi:mono/diheme cytochrome c family protein
MKNKNKIVFGIPAALFIGCTLFAVTSCTENPLSPGVEYMPDMYRSPSFETYVNYENPDSMVSRLPVRGTIAFSKDSAKAYINMPYPYPNTPEGYEAASTNLKNPLELSDKTIEDAKVLYSKFCVHCHGEQGNGDGSLVANDKFPPPPAYSKIAGLTEGKMFHTMTYGKGLMGSHASQLNKEERWKLVHYVKKLIGGDVAAAPADSASTVKAEVTKK